MTDDELILLTAADVTRCLRGREREIVDCVRRAYEAHAQGESMLPHSSFIRLTGRNRIIALPGYLRGGFDVAGIKWIASVPANVDRGMERASAVVILNSLETGRPQVIMEGSAINISRTAASAALAACCLMEGRKPGAVGVIGAGPIALETFRLLATTISFAETVLIYDLNRERAERFAAKMADSAPSQTIVAGSSEEVLKRCSLIVLATTATEPHIFDLPCVPGAVILHVSLRDLSARLILESDNIVDDPDHVCRHETSVHLAEKLAGHRRFIRATIGDLLLDRAEPRAEGARASVFSPFGLGVLDLAVAQLVFGQSVQQGWGTRVPSFFAQQRAHAAPPA